MFRAHQISDFWRRIVQNMLGKPEWNAKKKFFLITKDDPYPWDYCSSLTYTVHNKFKYKLTVLKITVFIK